MFSHKSSNEKGRITIYQYLDLLDEQKRHALTSGEFMQIADSVEPTTGPISDMSFEGAERLLKFIRGFPTVPRPKPV